MAQLDIFKFRALLKEKGLNYTTLANRMGLDRSTISSWVMGRTFPTDDNLKRLSQTLETEPEEIVSQHPNGLYVQSPNNHIIYNNFHISINQLIVPPDSKEFNQIMDKLFANQMLVDELDE